MRILYIITQADGGGAQKYTLALARHFGGAIAAGHQTGSDSACNEADRLFIEAQRFGLKTVKLEHLKRNVSPWNDFSAVWEIRELIKSYQPDIVHLNSTKAGLLGSFAAIGTKTKVVFTAHGFIFNEPLSWAIRSFYVSLEKTASAYRNFIITVSDADKNSALAYKLIAPDKIQTIHNGIGQIDFFTAEEAGRALNLPADKIIFGTVANFYKTKGVDILIDAVSMLNDEIKNHCRFIIIGDGTEIENCKLKIANLNLQNTIMLLGKKGGAAKYLKAFDCLIMPSRKEGFPYALLEAMQAGLPIIATNVGGIPEALGDAGILVGAENPEALAEAIMDIADDQEKRTKLSEQALQRSKLFTQEKMLSETEEVYELVMKK